MIKQTVEAISKLPDQKVQEISAFVDQLIQKFEDEEIKQYIIRNASQSEAFDFLSGEDDL